MEPESRSTLISSALLTSAKEVV